MGSRNCVRPGNSGDATARCWQGILNRPSLSGRKGARARDAPLRELGAGVPGPGLCGQAYGGVARRLRAVLVVLALAGGGVRAEETETGAGLAPGMAPLRALASDLLFGPPAVSGADRQVSAFFDGHDPAAGQPLLGGRGGGFFRGPARDFWFRPLPARSVAFAGFETTGRDPYLAGGFKRAVTGDLDQPGFRFLAMFGAKIRDYDPATGTRASRFHASRMGVGYEWHLASLSVSLLAGGSFVLNSTDAMERSGRIGRFGPFVMLDLWQDWGRDGPLASRFTALSAMLDQASRSSFVRLRHGFQVGDAEWRIGPEAAYTTGESQSRRAVLLQGAWRKARLGLHISEIPLWHARLALSGGAEWRHDRKTGAYMQIGAYVKY